MALIALTTAARVEVVESIEQMTLPAAEDITPGAAVRLDTSTGKFTNSNGSLAAEARTYGIAVGSHIISAGMPVTAVRRGVLDGYAFSQAYDAVIYVSDTDGRLGDAAGTVSVVVGRVLPGAGEVLGGSFARLLLVNL
ncbi:MAG: hypothetical protein NTW32_00160 [Chloroflexi bacterium]|nr:hypothetical protein [Chloroflexota bacterium]